VRVAPFDAEPKTAAGCSSAASDPPQRFSGMLLLSRSVGVPRRTGRFKLLVQCNGDQLCAGKASLRGLVGRRVGTLASGRFRIGVTQTGGPPIRGTVTLKLRR
jgi:hypothetical protein